TACRESTFRSVSRVISSAERAAAESGAAMAVVSLAASPRLKAWVVPAVRLSARARVTQQVFFIFSSHNVDGRHWPYLPLPVRRAAASLPHLGRGRCSGAEQDVSAYTGPIFLRRACNADDGSDWPAKPIFPFTRVAPALPGLG